MFSYIQHYATALKFLTAFSRSGQVPGMVISFNVLNVFHPTR
jgi:hypothetical protein